MRTTMPIAFWVRADDGREFPVRCGAPMTATQYLGGKKVGDKCILAMNEYTRISNGPDKETS